MPRGGESLVIDTGPDFRQQMLRAGLRRLTHVLYTHTHADHCHGFDDLRAFYFQQGLPVTCHVAAMHAADFRARFAYAFESSGYSGTKPQVILETFEAAPFMVDKLEVEPVYLPHGHVQTAAFRFGRFAYATDFKMFPDEVVDRWRGRIDVMVASGLHFGSHPTHSTIPETLALFSRLGVKRGYITHMTHNVLYAQDCAKLPPQAMLAHDGLSFTVTLS